VIGPSVSPGGDYDNDGDLDLAVGNNESNPSRVYRNEGGATFTLVWSGLASQDTESIAWGDYDNDGDLDLAAGIYNQANLVYRNEGNGVFTSVWGDEFSEFTYSFAWGDYDNDGDLDLAAGNDSRRNRVYRNDGGGVFTSVWDDGVIENDRSIAWGDYDNDGDLDLAAGKAGANRVYRNDGNGVFTSVWGDDGFTEDTRGGLAWGDYDNDGELDLLAGNWNAANRVYRNEGGGVFASVWGDDGFTENTYSIAWGDYDNDGDLDLAAGNNGEANRVYRGILFSSNSAPSPPGDASVSISLSAGLKLEWGNGSESVDPFDEDGNGFFYNIFLATESYASSPKTLIISTQPSTPLMGDYLKPHTTDQIPPNRLTITPEQLQQDNTYYFRVASIDAGLRQSAWSIERSTFVSGDTTAPDNITTLSALTGSGLNAIELSWLSPGDDAGAGEFNGEFWIAYTTITTDAENSSYWSTGAVQAAISTSGATPGSNHTYTFSNLDLGTTNYYFRIWARDDAANWSSLSEGATTTTHGWSSVWGDGDSEATRSFAWGDYDNDGDLDLAAGNINQANRVYRNDGGGAFNSVWSASSEPNDDTRSIAWGDYDNDGDLDMAVGNDDSEQSRVYRNDGGGTFTLVWSGPSLEDTYSIAWGDYDNDGDLDLAAGNFDQANRVYRNEGGGVFTSVWGDDGFAQNTQSIAWGDYDNDGDLDLAAGNLGAEVNRVYRNEGGGLFTSVWGDDGFAENTQSIAWGDYDDQALCLKPASMEATRSQPRVPKRGGRVVYECVG